MGMVSLPAGNYAYVGSARGGVQARIARHRRLAEQKAGKMHWHIEYLLVHPHVRCAGSSALEHGVECEISARFASLEGVTIPIPGFGASDCRAGCKAHLYLLPKSYPKGSKTLRLL